MKSQNQAPEGGITDVRIARRRVLKAGTGAGVMLLAANAGLGTALLPGRQASTVDGRSQHLPPRQQRAYQLRRDAARAYLKLPPPAVHTNGDEARYADKRASFSKTLPHNDLGEVDPQAYAAWLTVLASGDPRQFERVPRTPGATVKLNDPQATYAFDLVGVDSHATHLRPPPAFASAQMACEMAEVYWQALLRDVPFQAYDSHPLVAAAVADLNAFTHPLRAAQQVTPSNLFRGETAGDLIGPYLSQFLWLDIPYGIKTIDQRYRFPTRGQSFLVDAQEWLACQRGLALTTALHFDEQPRYLCSNCELAEYVHIVAPRPSSGTSPSGVRIS